MIHNNILNIQDILPYNIFRYNNNSINSTNQYQLYLYLPFKIRLLPYQSKVRKELMNLNLLKSFQMYLNHLNK